MSEWISVKDRLPEKRKRVLVVMHNCIMLVGSYHPDCICRGHWHGDGMGSSGAVPTHWMPLPPAPSGAGQAGA